MEEHKMKKFIAIVCILALSLGVLVGCGETENNQTDDSASKVGVVLVYDGIQIDVSTDEWDSHKTQVTTDDPALGKSYDFVGVTLADLMEIAGASDCTKVIVKAGDGYSTEIPVADVTSYSIMLANGYASGKSIDAGAGGPVKLVFPITDHPELSDTYDAWSWQWYVEEVEFVK